MDSELTFLIDLLLNEKLSAKVKTKVAERIKLIEGPKTSPAVIVGTTAIASQPIVQQVATATKRILGGEVETGTNIRGPRKF